MIGDVTGHLQRALELAEATRGRAYPKPDVGAVLVRDGADRDEGLDERIRRHGEIVAHRGGKATLRMARRST